MNINNLIKTRRNAIYLNNTLVSFSDIEALLQKEKQQRQRLEIKTIGKYLCEKYQYFYRLKEASEVLKYEKIISALRYETYKKNKNIIHYGDIADKAYVLLKGKVGVYSTREVIKQMSFDDFEQYVNEAKDKEENLTKYKRLIQNNEHINLFSIYSYGNQMLKCITEEEEQIGTFNDGFNFGDKSLMEKISMDVTIKALDYCILVSIDQYNYNEILRELEDKRLEKTFDGFKANFHVFKYWNTRNLLTLFNCFQHITLIQGDYLFKQNEDSDALYIVRSGTLDITSTVYFEWVSDYINYISYARSNVIYHTKDIEMNCDNKNVKKMFNAIKNKNKNALESCPCRIIHNEEIPPFHVSNLKLPFKENIIQIKMNEDKLIHQSINIKIRRVEKPELLGFEDSLELKKRFTTAKCVSTEAHIDKIPIYELFRLISNVKEIDKKLFLNLIAEQKMCLVTLIKNAVKSKAQELESKYTDKYAQFINNDIVEPSSKRLALKFQRTNTSLNDFVSIKFVENRRELSEVSKPKTIKKIQVSPHFNLSPHFIPSYSSTTLYGKNDTWHMKQSSICSSTRIFSHSNRFNKKNICNTSVEQGSMSMRNIQGVNQVLNVKQSKNEVNHISGVILPLNISSSPVKTPSYPILFSKSKNNLSPHSFYLNKECFLSSSYKKFFCNKKCSKDLMENTKSINEEDIPS